MADLFARLIDEVIGHEGRYANHPSDPGGETMWGITVGVARANGYDGPMAAMSREQAVAIYRQRYWIGPGFDQVAALSPMIAGELVDTGVNMGPAIALDLLQTALNGLNRQARDYPDLKVDGEWGPATRGALGAYLELRGPQGGELVLLRALNCLQGARYFQIVQGRAASEDFLFGWLRTRIA